ncbi:[FeFe] hydrogenase, group A [Sediminispirochaeta smaragdinae]|uniref:Hydrogenase, Fe-only n=1 Tax=Sediminispirochaeta smaragdinae (strain DSM 11293 / JCM 15392 / SEBR 4228) TaxID=573413 RepID=E1RAY1_SEDSS|nr:[FeFe] hydrogenase, group A [Sediminispirochaeta smaragdinae]ADK79511.1 hydrogenase, Fe-only [Sediminispirochaeta smaragdinae DSM 11293]
MKGYIKVDGIEVPLEGEENLLQVIRKAGIEIPTFCYHSELSVYGACRLCIVDIEGKGIQASCSTPPRGGMVVRTNTAEVRETRRMTLELLLANHDRECPTCERSSDCVLRDLASRYGIDKVRFRKNREPRPLDTLSDALVRDPNKCVLCGDCVRYCHEIQGIGAIDFAFRGEHVQVTPAFGRSIGEVDCINCGQCAAVCPTGAIIPKSEINEVWNDLQDEKSKVVIQIAPAVRVALGEMFGLPPGEVVTGKMVRALRMMGFDRIYDTAFAADLTVVEEAAEFLKRSEAGEGPLFTSCCPAWVKYAEQSLPRQLPNLSSCMSPQSMMGSLLRHALPEELSIEPEHLKIVSVMPCTAKKFEKKRPELSRDGLPFVDHVITTRELGTMIRESGIMLDRLDADNFDLPFGFASHLGVGFGSSGGVAEAVLNYLDPEGCSGRIHWETVEDLSGVRKTTAVIGGKAFSVAVVQGIKSAAAIAKMVQSGEISLDLIEVMACPGGCAGGAGQPVDRTGEKRLARVKAVRSAAPAEGVRHAGVNPFVREVYTHMLGCDPGEGEAHRLFHTTYHSRKRIDGMDIRLTGPSGAEARTDRIPVKVCVGTSCFLRGSQKVLSKLLHAVEEEKLDRFYEVQATFCSEQCDKGPTVHIGDRVINRADGDQIVELLREMVATLSAEG